MENKKIGLILGKFAPFHRGHEYLLNTALKVVDEVILVLYDCPDRTSIPLNARADWVRKLYPQIRVIEGWDAPNQHEDTPEVKRMQENYIGKLLGNTKITHFISSEYYGEHMSNYLNAENYIVDMERKKINISSTQIRQDRKKFRSFVRPYVLKDLTAKAVIIGLPSNNTEQIAKEVASKLQSKSISDNFLASLDLKGELQYDFKTIANKRIKLRSDSTIYNDANKIAIFNSSTLVDHCLNQLINRNYDQKLYEMAKTEMIAYDLIFVVQNSDSKDNLQLGIEEEFLINSIIGNLETLKIKYKLLSGTDSDLIKEITRRIEKYMTNHSN